ncbi:MAG TPA: hypothetical protein VIM58_11970 [Candidatus Methylacidiphilales bacterium]
MKKIAFLAVLVLLVAGAWIVWRFAPIHSGPFTVEGKLGSVPDFDVEKSRFLVLVATTRRQVIAGRLIGTHEIAFRNVPAGEYRLVLRLRDRDGVPVAETRSMLVSIPERARNPIALPSIDWQVYTPIHVGDVAPEYAFKTADGRPHFLSEFRGKWVLLAFHDRVQDIDLSALRDAHAAFGKRRDFIVLTLDIASDFARQGFPWIEGYTGPLRPSDVFPPFGLPAPEHGLLLVSPEGRLAARYDGGRDMFTLLAAKLPPEPAAPPKAPAPTKPKKK